MKNAALLLISTLLLTVVDPAMAATVSESGYTNDFSSQPPALDWATLTIAGAANNNYDMDSDVNTNITALGVTAPTTLDASNAPVAQANAVWSSSGLFLQTRPTQNRYTVLMGKFLNNTGTNATEVAISYLFTIAGTPNAEEAGRGTRVYYSLTGLTNSWFNLPTLNATAATGASVTTNLAVDWTNGGNLYLLWADDNANPGTDTGYQIDNFSLGVTAGSPLSTALVATLDAPTNNAVFVSGVSITATATPSRGTPPYTVEYFTNSGPGNTVFISAGSSGTAPYDISLGSSPAGVYNVYAVATDSAGVPASTNTLTNTFFVVEPLLVTLTDPTNGVTFDNVTTVLGRAMVSGGTAPYSVQFYLDNIANGAAVTSEPYERNFGALFVGDHTIRATVTDARNWVSNSAVHTVHITGPLGVTLEPTNGAVFNYGQAVTLMAGVGGGTAPYTLTFYTNGQLVASISAAPFATNLGILPPGSYTSYIQAVDSSVPMQQANSTTNVFTILPNPLAVTLTGPTNGQSVTAGAALTLAATANVGAPLSVTNVQFYFDGNPAGTDTTSPYSATVTPAAGNHSAYAVATDSLGRQSYSTTNSITATTVGPGGNNNFANAIPLSGPFVTTTGSNVGANKEFFEPNHGGNRGGASVWWSWTAGASGLTTIDTMGSSFDTLLGVYVGTLVNQLTTVAGNNDFNGNTWSRVQFNAVAGTVYYIAVDGFRPGNFGGPPAPTGDITLHIQGVGGLTITTPTNGMVVTIGDPIPISVTIESDFPNPPASRVDFYHAGSLFASVSNAPFSVVASNWPAGSNSLYVVATDAMGMPVPSAVVNVLVQNIGVTLLSPIEDTIFLNAAPIPVSAWGYLPSGSITNIEFFVDSVKFGEDATAPFSATWSNVVSGSHRLTAIGRSDAGASYNSQPVNIGVAATLMPFNAVWKFLDNGSDQGTNWIAPGFDDSSWASGPAPLGYSDSNGRPPATTNSFGPNPTAKYATTYYRQAVAITNLTAYTGIRLNIERDDGAIIYLNGSELARFNMPTGTVGYLDFAANNANDDGGTIFSTNLSPVRFIEGTNVFAVEIHQDAGDSSDIWFQMNLVGTPQIIHNLFPLVAITNPPNDRFFVGPSPIRIDAIASDADGSVAKVEFFADGVKLGETNAAPYSFIWNNASVAAHVLTAVATDDQGGKTTSEGVPIVVYDAAGTPVAAVTSPADGAVMEGPTNLLVMATAHAISGVTNVLFLANGVEFASDDAPPFFGLWNAPFGTNVLTAVAIDAGGVRGTSPPVVVVITIPPTNVTPPTIAFRIPEAAAIVTNLTNITIIFTERVQGVDAADLIISGMQATSVTGSGSNYTFRFPQPAYGEVEVTIAAGHGITDFGYPTNLPFNELSPEAHWEYELIDRIPPVLTARTPAPASVVSNLQQIAVTFSEVVVGVDAEDLLVNATPAFALSGSGSNYTFLVSQPNSGTVTVTWATNHGITDLAAEPPPNAFNRNGAGWTFNLDSRTIIVQTNALWRFVKGTNEASIPTNAWRELGFDDSGWSNSLAPFFYGETSLTNALNPGTFLGDMQSNYSTIYLRKEFNVANRSIITNLFLTAQADDGFIAWINGTVVARFNAPTGEVAFNATATAQANEPQNNGASFLVYTLTNGPAALINGTNILAVHAFNQNLTNSTDFSFNAQLYTFLTEVSFVAPRIVTVAPVQGDVLYLTNVTVTFSEQVTGVDAGDFLVNGMPADSVSSSNTTYSFSFMQPSYGPVVITWTTNHGIADMDDPPKPFNHAAASSTLRYTLINPSNPRVLAQVPLAGTIVTGLTSVTVTFTEPVSGVDAADFLVRARPAIGVTSADNITYTFTFPQPEYGTVSIGWATNHNIQDVEAGNSFDPTRFGAQWSYVLVDPVPFVTITSPPDNAAFQAPAAFTLRASVTDNDGTIGGVEFFEGAGKVGEATNAPYLLSFSNVVEGAYVFRAVATDNSGLKGTSAPVNILVVTSLPIALLRGPYLQVGTPTSGVVRWRTDLDSDAVIFYGTNSAALTNVAIHALTTNEHIVQLTGLEPETRYYYSIGSSAQRLTSGTNYWFVTSPVPGTRKPTRIWVIGDAGTAGNGSPDRQASTRDAYYNFAATNGPADFWLMLGDNAYNNGTDNEYQRAVFDIYPATLRNLFLWPTIGNHETAQSFTATDFPYLHIFSLPQNGEAGGLASGTPKYYSFDYANIHFVCLDSMTSGRSTNTAMVQWLQDDLAAATAEWIIVFFHHPPYTRGNHNSDNESELIEIRQNINPIMEAYGVDLVLAGHSHAWERSYLLHGHYGLSGTITEAMKVDPGDGREDGNGAYRKNELSQGVVYTVAGNAGQITGGQLNHPAHFLSLNELGSMVIDVSSNRLDAIFLATNGVARDHFTLVKRPSVAAPVDLVARAIGGNQIELTWSDVTNELGYIIERSLDGTNFTRLLTNAMNVTVLLDSGLLPETAYFYRVRAFNGDGESDNSSIADGFTGNRPPVLAAIPGFIAEIFHSTIFTNMASDPDPFSRLTFSLGADAPEGVRLDPTNGVFRWRPSREQAPGTNIITVVVTDDGTPALSDSKTFIVVVKDYVEMELGSAVMRAGDSGNVSINLLSTAELTNLNYGILLPRARLTGVTLENLVPARGQMMIDLTPVDGVLLGFAALPGQTLIGTQEIARLHFTAALGQQSAFIPIDISHLVVERAQAGLSPTVLLHSGRATVIGTQPLVEAMVDEKGTRLMTLYGIPGTTYTLEQSLTAGNIGPWGMWQTVMLTNLWQTLDASQATNAPVIFYRARE